MPWEPDASLLYAARKIAPIIRTHSEEAERKRRLSQPVLKALRETGLLRMTTPRSLGGLETDPVTRALVGEEIGRHDSAAAWTLENPLDWAFFCCRLPDEGAEEIYSGGADILIAAQFGRAHAQHLDRVAALGQHARRDITIAAVVAGTSHDRDPRLRRMPQHDVVSDRGASA